MIIPNARLRLCLRNTPPAMDNPSGHPTHPWPAPNNQRLSPAPPSSCLSHRPWPWITPLPTPRGGGQPYLSSLRPLRPGPGVTHSERRSGTLRRLHSPDALHMDMPHFVLGQSRAPPVEVSYQRQGLLARPTLPCGIAHMPTLRLPLPTFLKSAIQGVQEPRHKS